MATSKNIKVTADTSVESVIGQLPDAVTLSAASKLVGTLGRIESAIAVRSFESTLAVKRAVGQVLSAVVRGARTAAGADASKVGKVGDAVSFANIGHALGVEGSAWTWSDRARATLSDDHDAWLYATPDAVRQFRTADAPTFTNGKAASRDNVQHAIRWCKQQQNTGTTSNRAAGADDVNGPRVVVTSDDRVAIATALAAANGAGGEAVTMRVTAPTVVAALSALPDFVTPAWLAAISDAGLAALVLAVEGERKRRSVASKGKGTTSTPAPDAPAPDAPAADTADVVAALQEQMAQMAQVMASLVK